MRMIINNVIQIMSHKCPKLLFNVFEMSGDFLKTLIFSKKGFIIGGGGKQ